MSTEVPEVVQEPGVTEVPAVEEPTIEEAKPLPTEEVVTEPTFDDKVDLSSSELEAIDALVSVLESDNIEKEKTIVEKDARISELETKISELLAEKDGSLSEIKSRDEKLKEKDEAIALIEESWKLLQSHPQLGKLNEKLIKGETIDLSQSLIDYLDSEMASLPDTSSTTPQAPVVKPKLTGADRIRNARI